MATKGEVKERVSNKLKEPQQYKVIMWNDDFTTMEFVVDVLVNIFRKDEITANAIMLDVHEKGKGIVGKYPYDIAATKVKAALLSAREQGFPFRMTIEEA